MKKVKSLSGDTFYKKEHSKEGHIKLSDTVGAKPIDVTVSFTSGKAKYTLSSVITTIGDEDLTEYIISPVDDYGEKEEMVSYYSIKKEDALTNMPLTAPTRMVVDGDARVTMLLAPSVKWYYNQLGESMKMLEKLGDDGVAEILGVARRDAERARAEQSSRIAKELATIPKKSQVIGRSLYVHSNGHDIIGLGLLSRERTKKSVSFRLREALPIMGGIQYNFGSGQNAAAVPEKRTDFTVMFGPTPSMPLNVFSPVTPEPSGKAVIFISDKGNVLSQIKKADLIAVNKVYNKGIFVIYPRKYSDTWGVWYGGTDYEVSKTVIPTVLKGLGIGAATNPEVALRGLAGKFDFVSCTYANQPLLEISVLADQVYVAPIPQAAPHNVQIPNESNYHIVDLAYLSGTFMSEFSAKVLRIERYLQGTENKIKESAIVTNKAVFNELLRNMGWTQIRTVVSVPHYVEETNDLSYITPMWDSIFTRTGGHPISTGARRFARIQGDTELPAGTVLLKVENKIDYIGVSSW